MAGVCIDAGVSSVLVTRLRAGLLVGLSLGIWGCDQGGELVQDQSDSITDCTSALVGPSMVSAVAPGAGGYCIDSRETTQSEYADFLASTAGDTSGQRSTCEWNTSYQPNGRSECGASFAPNQRGEHPVACVDWCDAAAYCEWAGKRLCGRIGGGGLLNGNSEPWNPRASQWYNACSDGGHFVYPHGNVYRTEVCNGAESELGRTRSREEESGCHGVYDPYRSLFDMSGNVTEWEDGCLSDAGPTDTCYVRGGGYLTINDDVGTGAKENRLACLGNITGYQRNINDNPQVGFRCCTDGDDSISIDE